MDAQFVSSLANLEKRGSQLRLPLRVRNRTSLLDEWRWYAVWRGIEEAKQSRFSSNLFFRIRQSSGELGSGLVYPGHSARPRAAITTPDEVLECY